MEEACHSMERYKGVGKLYSVTFRSLISVLQRVYPLYLAMPYSKSTSQEE